jgi:DNA (cytosine-5)-methyltransferase 1
MFGLNDRKHAMGIDWMTGAELSQAIPPAYTEYIGKRLIARLENVK